MDKIIKPAVVLAVVAFASSLLLSHVKKITYPNILRQQQEKQIQALAIVLPGYSDIEKKTVQIDGADFTFWQGSKNDDKTILKGYAFITSRTGFSGDVESMVGVDESGKILGISVLLQTETPGLGARCQEIASSNTFLGTLLGSSSGESEQTLPWFQLQFNGLDTRSPMKVVKQGDWNPSMRENLIGQNAISAITGATITSRTILKSVESGVVLLNKALESMGTENGKKSGARKEGAQ